MAKDKVIELKGIIRNTKDSASQDGECDEIINLRFKDNSWRPVGNLTKIEGFDGLGARGYERLYVHTNEYRHLFGVQGGNLYWIGNISDASVVTPFLLGGSGHAGPQLIKEGVSTDMRICQTGHLMVVIDGGLSYYLYRPYANRYDRVITDYNNVIDGRLLPYGNVELKVELECADDGRPFVFSSWIDSSGYSGTKTNAEKAEVMKDVIYKTQKDIAALNRFWGAFLACTAAELYDGTFILMSQPSLMLAPNVKSSDKYQNANIQYVNSNATTSISSTWARYNNINQNLCDEIYNYFKAGGTQTGVLTTSDICNDVREGRLYYFPKSGTEPDGVNDEILPIGLSETDYNYNQELITDANFKAKAIDRYLELKYGWSRLPNTTSDSYPVIKNTKHEVPFYARWSVTDDATECFHFANKLRYRITSSVPAEYKDVIKNISVFVTPQAQMLSLDNNVSYGTTAANLIYDYRTIANITKELMGEAMMYKIGEIKTEDFTEANVGQWVDLKIEDGVLTNLLSQERLVTDANGRNSYDAKVAFPYNNRLHIADYVEELFHGWLLDHFFYNEGVGQYANANVGIVGRSGTDNIGWIKVTLDDNGTSKVVVRDVEVPDTAAASQVLNASKQIRYLNPLLSYPDRSAKTMEIYIRSNTSVLGQNNTFHQTYTLTAHDSLNMAYYVTPDLRPVDTHLGSVENLIPSPAEVNSTEAHHNRIKVSKMNNPLYFPYETVYAVGNGKITGMAANEMVLATGQIGDAPLYVFCSDGVYGLFVDSSGQLTYNFARVISEYVCNNAGGILNIHGGVLFPTEKGYVLLEGLQTRDVTDKIEGEPFSGAAIAEWQAVANHSQLVRLYAKRTTEDFLEFIKGCVGGYNFADKEVWLTNKTKGYSYIIDRHGMFTKRTDCGVQLVNDFPRTYLLDVNGSGQTKVSTLKSLITEGAGARETMFLTRAIKNDTQEFKQTQRLVARGEFRLPSTGAQNVRVMDLRNPKSISMTDVIMREVGVVTTIRQGAAESVSELVPAKIYANHIAVCDTECGYEVKDADSQNIDLLDATAVMSATMELFRVGYMFPSNKGWKSFRPADADDIQYNLILNSRHDGNDIKMRLSGNRVYKFTNTTYGAVELFAFGGWEGTPDELLSIVGGTTDRGRICIRRTLNNVAVNKGLYTFTVNASTQLPHTQEVIGLTEINTHSNYMFAYIYLNRGVTPNVNTVLTSDVYLSGAITEDMPCYDLMNIVVNEAGGIYVPSKFNNTVSIGVGNNRLYLDEAKSQWVVFSSNTASTGVYADVLDTYNSGGYNRPLTTSVRYLIPRNTYVRLVDAQNTYVRTIFFNGNGAVTWLQLMDTVRYPSVTLYDKDSTYHFENGVYYRVSVGYYNGQNVYVTASFQKRYVGTTGDLTLEKIVEYQNNASYFQAITLSDRLSAMNVLLNSGDYMTVTYYDGNREKTMNIYISQAELTDALTFVGKIIAGSYDGWDSTAKMAGLYLFGSYDNKVWKFLGGRNKGGEYRDLGLISNRTDCKYFRLLFVGQLSTGSSIEYIESLVDDRVFRRNIR